MTDDAARRHALGRRVVARREEITAYLRRSRPRRDRLALAGVVGGSLAALGAAGPAVGGEGFNAVVSSLFGLSSDASVWQVLCLVALLFSLLAAISSALLRHLDLVARIATAENAAAELGAVATALEFEQITLREAVARYGTATTAVAFVEEGATADGGPQPPTAPRGPASGPGGPRPPRSGLLAPTRALRGFRSPRRGPGAPPG